MKSTQAELQTYALRRGFKLTPADARRRYEAADSRSPTPRWQLNPLQGCFSQGVRAFKNLDQVRTFLDRQIEPKPPVT